MLQQVRQLIQSQDLIRSNQKVLVAVSGGIDSMVMLHLLHMLGFDLTIAHCNFSLRGEESEADEAFVQNTAGEMGIRFLLKRFDTQLFAQEKRLSIQMAARELRYAWFEELIANQGFDSVAVAHHRDDQVETFFINLLRGSGIHGLRAMQVKNGHIIRPLLFVSSKEIRQFADQQGIKWRDDSSNSQDKYLRNKIRHQLIPLLEDINAAAPETIAKSTAFINLESQLYDELVTEKLQKIVIDHPDMSVVDKCHFLDNSAGLQLLHEIMRQYGFSSAQTQEVFDCLRTAPGAVFSSESHFLAVGRDQLEIAHKTRVSHQFMPILIEQETAELTQPVNLTFKTYTKPQAFQPDRSGLVAQLDQHKLKFPLQLRAWKTGDRFQPFGMRGTKLLSDYFIDQHYSYFQKQQALLLVDADDEIVWVVGQRIDDRWKVRSATQQVYEVALLR